MRHAEPGDVVAIRDKAPDVAARIERIFGDGEDARCAAIFFGGQKFDRFQPAIGIEASEMALRQKLLGNSLRA